MSRVVRGIKPSAMQNKREVQLNHGKAVDGIRNLLRYGIKSEGKGDIQQAVMPCNARFAR